MVFLVLIMNWIVFVFMESVCIRLLEIRFLLFGIVIFCSVKSIFLCDIVIFIFDLEVWVVC